MYLSVVTSPSEVSLIKCASHLSNTLVVNYWVLAVARGKILLE